MKEKIEVRKKLYEELRKDALMLIDCHLKKDDKKFKETALALAREFENSEEAEENGDFQLGEWIYMQYEETPTLIPQ